MQNWIDWVLVYKSLLWLHHTLPLHYLLFLSFFRSLFLSCKGSVKSPHSFSLHSCSKGHTNICVWLFRRFNTLLLFGYLHMLQTKNIIKRAVSNKQIISLPFIYWASHNSLGDFPMVGDAYIPSMQHLNRWTENFNQHFMEWQVEPYIIYYLFSGYADI